MRAPMMGTILHKARRIYERCRDDGVGETLRLAQDRLAKLAWDYWLVGTPRRLVWALDDISIDRPIFVLGTQGGGLTLLTRMIRRHPSVVMVGGGPSFWTGNDEMDKHYVANERLPDALSLRSPRYYNMTGREREHPYFGYERSWLYATDELLSDYRLTAEDHTPDLERRLRERIRMSIRAYARNVRRARFLDMSQTFTLKIPFLRACFPDARFVLVTRNPYVMCWREVSRRTEDKYRDWNRWPPLAHSLRLVAEHWRNSFTIARADLDSLECGLVLRFEDILQDPEAGLRRILNHVDLSFDTDMLPQPHHTFPTGSKSRSKWYPIRPDVNDRYLQTIPNDAVEVIETILDGAGAEFGYDPPSLRGNQETASLQSQAMS